MVSLKQDWSLSNQTGSNLSKYLINKVKYKHLYVLWKAFTQYLFILFLKFLFSETIFSGPKFVSTTVSKII